MKKLVLLIGTLLAFQVHAEPIGIMVYFNIVDAEQSDDESGSDFYFYYDKMKEFLAKKGIEVLLVEKEPIRVVKPNYTLELSVKDTGTDVGIVFIKPTGEYMVSRGIGTDMDVATEAENYFKVKLIGK